MLNNLNPSIQFIITFVACGAIENCQIFDKRLIPLQLKIKQYFWNDNLLSFIFVVPDAKNCIELSVGKWNVLLCRKWRNNHHKNWKGFNSSWRLGSMPRYARTVEEPCLHVWASRSFELCLHEKLNSLLNFCE